MPITLFDDIVAHTDMADLTQYMVVGLAPDPEDSHATRSVTRMVLQKRSMTLHLGYMLGVMLRQSFGARDGADVLVGFIEAAGEGFQNEEISPRAESEGS